MPLKLIDGELVEVNDDGQPVDEENTEQVNNTNNNQNISEEVDNNQEVDDRPNWFDEIANEVLSTPATANDIFLKAPYNASRKFLNSVSSLTEDIGDTLGETTNLGGFRYGKDAQNGLIEYVPYNKAVDEKDQVETKGILFPITGSIGVEDSYNIKAPDNEFLTAIGLNPSHYTNRYAPFGEGMMQFMIGFKGIDKFVKIAKTPSLSGKFAKSIATGAGADFIAFDDDMGRLTDVLHEYYPNTVDDYLGYLKSDPDDKWYEARLKNTLEGAGIGGTLEGIFSLARYYKHSKLKKDYAQKEQDLEKIAELDSLAKQEQNISSSKETDVDEIDELYNYNTVDKEQSISSAETDVNFKSNRKPAIYENIDKNGGWKENSVSLEIGSGKGRVTDEFLNGKKVTNIKYDPYRLSPEENAQTIQKIKDLKDKDGGVDNVVIANVLNVVPEKTVRRRILEQAKFAIKDDGVVYIDNYKAPKEGATKQGFQLGKANKEYIAEIEEVFGKNSARIVKGGHIEVVKSPIGKLKNIDPSLKRDAKFGVGKTIGGQTYVHKSSESKVVPKETLNKAKKSLPKDFDYAVVRYDSKNGTVAFTKSADFDTNFEPTVGDTILVRSDGTTLFTGQKANEQIYHHKWTMVDEGYKGFDIDENIRRSEEWKSMIGNDREVSSKIGYRDYWRNNIVPKLRDKRNFAQQAVNQSNMSSYDKVNFTKGLKEIPKEMKENFELYKEGKISFDEALTLNSKYINIKPFIKDDGLDVEGAKALIDIYDNIYKSKVKKVLTDEELKRLALKRYPNNPEGIERFIREYKNYAKGQKDAPALVYAGEAYFATLAKALPSLARQFIRGETTAKELETYIALFRTIAESRGQIAEGIGRQLRIFGITKDGTYDINGLIQNLNYEINNFSKWKGGKDGFENLAKQLAQTDDPNVLVKVFKWAFQNRTWNILNEVWINAILSSPKTIFANLTGNTGLTAIAPLEQGLGSLLSKGDFFVRKAVFGGDKNFQMYKEFDKEMRESFGIYKYIVKSLEDGFKYTGVAFKQENPVLTSASEVKVDSVAQKAIQTKGDTLTGKAVNVVGSTVRLPSRALNATDEFFMQINYRAKLEVLADRYAKEKTGGKVGTKPYNDAVEQYKKDSFDETGLIGTNEEALTYAKEMTFKNELVGFVSKINDLVNGYPVLKQFFPFIKVTWNLTKATTDRMLPIYRLHHLMGISKNPEMIAKARGQMAVGAMLMTMAYNYYRHNELSNSGGYADERYIDPFSESYLLRFKKSKFNFTDYSVKGDSGVQNQVKLLAPFGTIFNAVAEYARYYDYLTEKERDAVSALLMSSYVYMSTEDVAENYKGMRSLGKAFRNTIANQTFTKNFHSFLDAMLSDDEQKLKKFIGNHIASYIPNIIVKAQNDPYMRDVREMLDGIKQRLGVQNSAEPYIDILYGEARDIDPNLDRFLQRTINPFTQKEYNNYNPLYKELLRLDKTFSAPKSKMTFNGTPVDLKNFENVDGRSAYMEFAEQVRTTKIKGKTLNEMLLQAINSPEYKKLPDPLKSSVIREAGLKDYAETKIDYLNTIRKAFVMTVIGNIENNENNNINKYFDKNTELPFGMWLENKRTQSVDFSKRQGEVSPLDELQNF